MLAKDWKKTLKRLRLTAGLSQERAAELCELSHRMYQYYESGEYQPREPMAAHYSNLLVAHARKLLKQPRM